MGIAPRKSPRAQEANRSMLSFGALASKVFGSSNDRKLKKYGPIVAQINALEPEVAALSDEALRARTDDFRARVARRHAPRRSDPRGLRHGARSRQAHDRPTPFRRAADRRHGAARRPDRRDEDRRRQDAGRHAPRLSQRARRQGRACRHRQRLSRQARRRVDGRHLQVPGAQASAASCTSSPTRSGASNTPAT